MKAQLASALPRFGGANVKSRQRKILPAFLSYANISFSKNPIFCSRRRVSITRICERLARAALPFTNPTDILSLCSRGEVVSGMIIQALGPKPRTMTPGRTYQSPFPSCSVPTLTPNRHHQISRTVYKRGCSAWVFFFTSFQPSKSFIITLIL